MKELFLLPNLLSLFRLFASFLLCIDNSTLRILTIILCGITDGLDGFLARKYNMTSTLGTLLDPIADKVFVLVALYVFGLSWWQNILFLSREISLIAFGIWVRYTKCRWSIRSFVSGKLMTTCQFCTLFLLASQLPVPTWLFIILGLFGAASFIELRLLARAKCL